MEPDIELSLLPEGDPEQLESEVADLTFVRVNRGIPKPGEAGASELLIQIASDGGESAALVYSIKAVKDCLVAWLSSRPNQLTARAKYRLSERLSKDKEVIKALQALSDETDPKKK